MIYTLIVLRNDKMTWPIDTISRNNDFMHITIMSINPKIYNGAKMRRYNEVYVDMDFLLDEDGKTIAETVLKPLATLGQCKFQYI